MKKVILVVILLVAVAAIGLPPVIGGMTESTVRSRIEQMDDNPMFAMRVGDYERGWFTSRTQVEIGLDERYFEMIMAGAADIDADPAELAATMREQSITVPVDLAHGPIILMDGLHFGLSRLHAVLDDRDDLAALVTQELGLDYVAELHGQVSYFGTFSFTSNVPPIEYIDESSQLSFAGLNLDGTARGQDLQLEGGMDSLTIDTDGTAITIQNFHVASDSSRINQILWEGEFDSGIESLAIVDTLAGADGAIELTGLRASGGADVDASGELLEATVTYAAEAVRLPADDMQLADAELTIDFENFSVEALTDYYEAALSMDPQNPGASAMAMQATVGRLLEHNPAISFDPIRFTLDDESLTAALSLRTVNGDQGNFDLMNPIMLLGMFEASASLNASKPLFEDLAGRAAAAQFGSVDPAQMPPGQDVESMAEAQAQLMIATFLGQGYIVDDGENYSTEIEYANGEIRINGMPLPLGALLQ